MLTQLVTLFLKDFVQIQVFKTVLQLEKDQRANSASEDTFIKILINHRNDESSLKDWKFLLSCSPELFGLEELYIYLILSFHLGINLWLNIM